MKILVTNDDGWDAAGISHLASVASDFGDVTIVAPLKPQSGVGHQLTLDREMEFIKQGPQSYALDGTPADCVRFGLHHLGESFDWVLSGINHGANLGVDVYRSGTIAAAREANFHGVNAIALSQYRTNMAATDFDWQRSTTWCRELLATFMSSTAGEPQLININFPDGVGQAMPEVVSCPCDVNPLSVDYSNSNGVVKFTGSFQDRPRTSGHDIDVCLGGKIAISHLG